MTKKELLRGLPKIDEVLKQESLVVLSEEKGDLMVTEAVRAVIAGLRASILDLSDKKAEEFDASALEIEAVAEAAEAKVLRDEELNLYPLINATGTILHTNLGRA
ncbi:MAG: L-seryl-tRNA(Sec) selenium transferase, partial [Mogibacterium sp.]|nr:L-seryl-tRNA(Sec) selenium transferase [Mogibacterium sp.]